MTAPIASEKRIRLGDDEKCKISFAMAGGTELRVVSTRQCVSSRVGNIHVSDMLT